MCIYPLCIKHLICAVKYDNKNNWHLRICIIFRNFLRTEGLRQLLRLSMLHVSLCAVCVITHWTVTMPLWGADCNGYCWPPHLSQAGAPSPSCYMCWLWGVYSSSFSRELFSVQWEPPEAMVLHTSPGEYSGANDSGPCCSVELPFREAQDVPCGLV